METRHWIAGRALVLALVALTVGCGDDDASGTGGNASTGGSSSTGGAGTGGAGAGAAGGAGGAGGGVADDCRRYLTAGDISSVAFTGTVSGAFDEGSLTYTSEVSDGAATTITVVSTYASVADFVDEAKTMGRWLLATQVFSGAYEATETYQYDQNRRLTDLSHTETNGADWSRAFSQWDGQGRPTDGAFDLDPNAADCTGVQLTVNYDDDMRRRTAALDFSSGVGADCGSAVRTSWDELDADGNPSAQDRGDGDVWTYTITATEMVCKP